MMGALALKYSRTFVSHDAEKDLTCLWIYEKQSRMVLYSTKRDITVLRRVVFALYTMVSITLSTWH